jgi:hypothetical protein
MIVTPRETKCRLNGGTITLDANRKAFYLRDLALLSLQKPGR